MACPGTAQVGSVYESHMSEVEGREYGLGTLREVEEPGDRGR